MPEPPVPAEEGETPRGGLRVILIIDDDDGPRTIGRRVLSRFGYEVLTAESGLAGLAAFDRERHRIALVIVDLTMPGMSGADVFHSLRSRNADLPIVISTGHTEEEALGQLGGPAPAAFIQKPFRLAELTGVVSRILGV